MIVATKRRSKKARSPVVPQPSGWMDIQVGAVVLASIAPRPTEWFEVVVTGIEGETFTVRFCDWPAEPTFTRSREQLALMHRRTNPCHRLSLCRLPKRLEPRT